MCVDIPTIKFHLFIPFFGVHAASGAKRVHNRDAIL